MTFQINENELQKVEEIKKALTLLFNNYSLEYRFFTSAIGITIKVYCSQIDKEFDITDYDSW